MMITVVGITNPKTRIKSMYDLLLFDECQSGAHPRPEISGIYLPHPNKGGIDRQNEYTQMKDIIAVATWKDETVSVMLPK